MVFFSAKDWYVIHASVVIVLFWAALWNLSDEVIAFIEERYGIKRWKQSIGLLVIVLIIISVDPYLFEKL